MAPYEMCSPFNVSPTWVKKYVFYTMADRMGSLGTMRCAAGGRAYAPRTHAAATHTPFRGVID